jgi:hypothetical protein
LGTATIARLACRRLAAEPVEPDGLNGIVGLDSLEQPLAREDQRSGRSARLIPFEERVSRHDLAENGRDARKALPRLATRSRVPIGAEAADALLELQQPAIGKLATEENVSGLDSRHRGHPPGCGIAFPKSRAVTHSGQRRVSVASIAARSASMFVVE